jgi:hypothetical protein
MPFSSCLIILLLGFKELMHCGKCVEQAPYHLFIVKAWIFADINVAGSLSSKDKQTLNLSKSSLIFWLLRIEELRLYLNVFLRV